MPLNTMKVYFDGSHYIGIPYKEKPKKKNNEKYNYINNQIEEVMAVVEDEVETGSNSPVFEVESDLNGKNSKDLKSVENPPENHEQKLYDLFEKLYNESLNKSRTYQRKYILDNILKMINNYDIAVKYVDENLDKKIRNLIVRRMRLARKVALNEFNYFVTFTYDDNKQTEESFKNRLRKCLSNYATRYSWQYAGVWEGKAQNKRLHFHGIFNIPNGKMPGELIEKNDFSRRLHRCKKTVSNTFFEKKFGRCDFEKIETPILKNEAIKYLMKYLEKSGEKIVYSRGLARYFISGIEDDDILCSYDEFDTKFILFDDFKCWDDGCYIGEISRNIINLMPKIV